MEKISNAFDEIIRDLGLEKAVAVERIRKKWKAIIGETISIHTSPSFINHGQLIIHVDSPEWLHELQFHQGAILSKLKPFGINKIRLKLGRIELPPQRSRTKRPARGLTVREMDFIEDTTADIDNDLLKERIKKAIEKSLGRA